MVVLQLIRFFRVLRGSKLVALSTIGLLLVLAIVGCGGGSDDGVTPGDDAATDFEEFFGVTDTENDDNSGPVNATYREGDRESLLHNYLVLIRKIRGEQREPTITLRGADISALAEHLGASEERVLEDLLDEVEVHRVVFDDEQLLHGRSPSYRVCGSPS